MIFAARFSMGHAQLSLHSHDYNLTLCQVKIARTSTNLPACELQLFKILKIRPDLCDEH